MFIQLRILHREERRLSSFTPHTYSMGLMLRNLHNDLLAVLSMESDPTVLAGTFKAWPFVCKKLLPYAVAVTASG